MPVQMGPWEIALILLVVLIIFGVGKLPQVGGAIGRGIREFRRAQQGQIDEQEKKLTKRKVGKNSTNNDG